MNYTGSSLPSPTSSSTSKKAFSFTYRPNTCNSHFFNDFFLGSTRTSWSKFFAVRRSSCHSRMSNEFACLCMTSSASSNYTRTCSKTKRSCSTFQTNSPKTGCQSVSTSSTSWTRSWKSTLRPSCSTQTLSEPLAKLKQKPTQLLKSATNGGTSFKPFLSNHVSRFQFVTSFSAQGPHDPSSQARLEDRSSVSKEKKNWDRRDVQQVQRHQARPVVSELVHDLGELAARRVGKRVQPRGQSFRRNECSCRQQHSLRFKEKGNEDQRKRKFGLKKCFKFRLISYRWVCFRSFWCILARSVCLSPWKTFAPGLFSRRLRRLPVCWGELCCRTSWLARRPTR